MTDVQSTTYIYEYKLGDFLFEGDAVVEIYDPQYSPAVTISNVFLNETRLPKPLQSDWLIDKLQEHVLTLWQLERI